MASALTNPGEIAKVTNIVEQIWPQDYVLPAGSPDNWGLDLLDERPTSDRYAKIAFKYFPHRLRKSAVGAEDAYSAIHVHDYTLGLDQFDIGVEVELADLGTMLSDAEAQAVAYRSGFERVPQDEMVKWLNDGETAAYGMPHGSTFFGNAIPIMPGSATTYDNLLAGTGNISLVDIATALACLRMLTAPDGRASNLPGTHLIVPVQQEIKAQELVRSVTIEEAGYRRDVAQSISGLALGADSGLDDANDWFLFHSSPNSRPFRLVRHAEYGVPQFASSTPEEVIRKKAIRIYGFVWAKLGAISSLNGVKMVSA